MSYFRKCRALWFGIALICASHPLSARAEANGQFVFQRVLDENSSPPGRPAETFFTPGGDSVEIHDKTVFVRANAVNKNAPFSEFSEGVFAWRKGELSTVVDTEMSIPVLGGDTFFDIGGATSDGETVVFEAFNPGKGIGLYASRNGVVSRLVDGDTVLNDAGRTFASATGFAVEGDTVAFGVRLDDGTEGVATHSLSTGESGVLVDEFAQFPNQAPGDVRGFRGIGGVTDGKVVFYGWENHTGELVNRTRGIYTVDAEGLLEVVADEQSMPEFSDTGFRLGSIPFSVSGDTVAFQAGTGSGEDSRVGVYSADLDTGAFATVGDRTIDLPLNPGEEIFFATTPSADGENVAFIGGGIDVGVLFLQREGELHRVLGEGDWLGGREVQAISLGANGLSGDSLAFTVGFTDDSYAVYMATYIPSPGIAPLFGMGALFAGRRRRR